MRNVILIGAIVFHFVLVGADAFAQFTIVPVVLSAPPASLTMYQGEYVYDSSSFWRMTNMFAFILIFISVILHWSTSRRNLLLTTLTGTIIISFISLKFIFPEYNEIVSSAYSTTIDPVLVEQGARWRVVAFVRLVLFAGLGLLPLWALSKNP